MVGIRLDDGPQTRRFKEFAVALVQLERDGRPALAALRGGEDKLAFAVGTPLPNLVAAALAARHRDLFCDHERRVEPHAELADQGHVLGRVSAEVGHEFRGPRTGDGAEIGRELVVGHADPVVGDSEPRGRFFDGKGNLEVAVGFQQLGRCEGGVAQTIARVRGV